MNKHGIYAIEPSCFSVSPECNAGCGRDRLTVVRAWHLDLAYLSISHGVDHILVCLHTMELIFLRMINTLGILDSELRALLVERFQKTRQGYLESCNLFGYLDGIKDLSG